MKSKQKDILQELAMFIVGGVVLMLFANWLFQEEPKEYYVGDSSVMWKGEITRCGLDEKVDALSLYCRGYKEGYEWGGEQAVMFCKLDKELGN